MLPKYLYLYICMVTARRIQLEDLPLVFVLNCNKLNNFVEWTFGWTKHAL